MFALGGGNEEKNIAFDEFEKVCDGHISYIVYIQSL